MDIVSNAGWFTDLVEMKRRQSYDPKTMPACLSRVLKKNSRRKHDLDNGTAMSHRYVDSVGSYYQLSRRAVRCVTGNHPVHRGPPAA